MPYPASLTVTDFPSPAPIPPRISITDAYTVHSKWRAAHNRRPATPTLSLSGAFCLELLYQVVCTRCPPEQHDLANKNTCIRYDTYSTPFIFVSIASFSARALNKSTVWPVLLHGEMVLLLDTFHTRSITKAPWAKTRASQTTINTTNTTTKVVALLLKIKSRTGTKAKSCRRRHL